jgi:ribonuclease Y
MSIKIVLILLAVTSIAGVALGYVLRLLITLGQRGSLELEIKQKMLDAKERAQKVLEEAESKAEKMQSVRLSDVKELEEKLEKTEERLIKREELLDDRERSLQDTDTKLDVREREVNTLKKEVDETLNESRERLAKIAHLSQDEAKDILLSDIEKAFKDSLLTRIQKLDAYGKEQLEDKAREILVSSVHRLANAVNSELTTLAVSLPSDEVKGKIIGKEGRNIRTFERLTGVDLIIDDIPDKITISCFDPLRRHVAKIALEKLVEDGRIQPAKIEEFVEKAKEEVDATVKIKGEQAAYEARVLGLDPKLITLLGRLHFRTSYGQNVLQHSIEMAHIANMLALELGADSDVARAGALLHDIGKAVDHEVQGTHVEIGRKILEKFGVDVRIIKAMQSHHEEYPYETLESKIVQSADALSASRPGARQDSAERYVERLTDLERIAMTFPGVEKTYAISAGREIRVFVNPGKVPDIAMHKLAREIAERIQEDLKFPGEIKVNIIRENRVVEFAR